MKIRHLDNIFFGKCNFPMTPHVVPLIGWLTSGLLAGWLVVCFGGLFFHIFLKKQEVKVPFGALVNFKNEHDDEMMSFSYAFINLSFFLLLYAGASLQSTSRPHIWSDIALKALFFHSYLQGVH